MDSSINSQLDSATIWDGDLLGRRQEAHVIQCFIEHETRTFLSQGRDRSLVLAIDAEYGEGKSWFLRKLADQLSLSHPVARIDAWADDASEEPLTAFMSSIDDALSPFLTKSKKLRDKVAAAKVAAFPVMGRLVRGVMIKGLSKVAGEGADQALADAFDGALEGARASNNESEAGVAALMVEGAMEELGKTIDSLVDRRGAAMLAEYRQRRKSREGFRKNMRDLVAEIDNSEISAKTPLVVIIDELDRCRPDYAIRVLEEIKHFFDVPGVVFILAIHRPQLVASIGAVYGQSFNSEEYIRRFFDRRWELRRLTTSEIVDTQWLEFGGLSSKFDSQVVCFEDEKVELVPEKLVSQIFDAHSVKAREAFAILDALRVFAQTWDHPTPISTLIATPMAINLVRQRAVEDFSENPAYRFLLPSSIPVNEYSHRQQNASTQMSIRYVLSKCREPIIAVNRESITREAEYNFALHFMEQEAAKRRASDVKPDINSWSLISEYADRLERIEGFIVRDFDQ